MRIILESIGIYIACVAAVPVTFYIGHFLLEGVSGNSLIFALLAIYLAGVFLIYRALRLIISMLR